MRPPISTFWGKARLDPTQHIVALHPLTDHCLDVALTFRVLVALPIIRRRLEAAAGRPLSDVALDRLAVFALLHDLGKSNLGFQNKIFQFGAPRAGHIRELAPLFFEEDLSEGLAYALDVNTLGSWFVHPRFSFFKNLFYKRIICCNFPRTRGDRPDTVDNEVTWKSLPPYTRG